MMHNPYASAVVYCGQHRALTLFLPQSLSLFLWLLNAWQLVRCGSSSSDVNPREYLKALLTILCKGYKLSSAFPRSFCDSSRIGIRDDKRIRNLETCGFWSKSMGSSQAARHPRPTRSTPDEHGLRLSVDIHYFLWHFMRHYLCQSGLLK